MRSIFISNQLQIQSHSDLHLGAELEIIQFQFLLDRNYFLLQLFFKKRIVIGKAIIAIFVFFNF